MLVPGQRVLAAFASPVEGGGSVPPHANPARAAANVSTALLIEHNLTKFARTIVLTLLAGSYPQLHAQNALLSSKFRVSRTNKDRARNSAASRDRSAEV